MVQPIFRKLLKYAGLSLFAGLGYCCRPPGIPVLVYHSLDSTNSRISIAPAIFAMQMEQLDKAGFRVIGLEQFMSAAISREHPSEKVLVLTFDDGLKNFYESAWPILNERGFSATVFVPTDFIGQKSWWYSRYALTPLPMLDEKELRELHRSGVDIQSHGCSHRKLTDLSPPEVDREVRQSKAALERILEKPVDFFCYPFGEVNQDIVDSVRNAGYKGGISMVQGLHRKDDNPYMMKRQSLDYISIADGHTANLSIKACVFGTFAWYVRAKQTLLRLFA
ncbi:MAG: polysaccharide deacetylase family protein [Nitrospirota bacterium]